MLVKPNTQARPNLEQWFAPYREKVVGFDQRFLTPFGEKPIVYADWTASGRLYGPIEDQLLREIGPFVGNTHTETTVTGCTMTGAYHEAKALIKQHVGAHKSDILISTNSGMTGVVNKFQRILGLKIHEHFRKRVQLQREERPVVFISHMEHHSNQTTWLETIAEVEVIRPNENGLMDLGHLEELLEKYADRSLKIAAVTSCSNVTGIKTPYYEVAEIMHRNGGLCFVDFACSAPYIEVCMRPENELQHLDAIYFSPHKFLGGPGSSGILVFDPKLYKNQVPDNPGGGTVDWTNPWGGHKYIDQIEAREDGGTPAFLQTIKVALAIKLKEKMGVDRILEREHELLDMIWDRFDRLPRLHILASQHRERIGVISFYIDDLHYNLGVKLLNDRYGVQVRGGCSCAGTYGHYLLNVDQEFSQSITDQISQGILSAKPGWIRLSIHPVMTNEEMAYILDAIEALHDHYQDWAADYEYNLHTNEFYYKDGDDFETKKVAEWFDKITL
ncbi:aminotransferase class V-fold PLP-dependent enzyme [Flavilitoribacter nigricans]|uniref:Selenocysteine lyase n=1 Tax=Flavilitoribacter nigricans (strain ATCC 23147 / DSM 23189 / NBRC 102662 / NCIMB 1420 / SS-2) TaxID=1122177 RepID=A0A2D0NL79_FLAN2|nr:aminotransferase class V-fold PLP-dependent enzyme [Flavilitoribacter nigricans]PHN08493.1 selenocysteine lyase [Flavilitoribacter nigricans DSM 23189 = NBRC 102662]